MPPPVIRYGPKYIKLLVTVNRQFSILQLAAMLIYVGLLLLTCCHSVLAAACINNDQCSFTETCVNGQCVPTIGAACTSNDDCRPNQICLFGNCLPNPNWPTAATPGSGGSGGTTGLPPPGTGPGTLGSPCRSISDCGIEFICQNNICVKNPAFPSVSPPTTQVPRLQCPEGWMLHDNKCYVVFGGAYTQPEASVLCQGIGGQLAVLDNPLANLHVNQLNLMRGGGPYWIGLQKFGSTWVWRNGTSFAMAAYTNWRPYPKQPDNCCPLDAANCVVADYDNSAGQWDDAGCDFKSFGGKNFGVACEKVPS